MFRCTCCPVGFLSPGNCFSYLTLCKIAEEEACLRAFVWERQRRERDYVHTVSSQCTPAVGRWPAFATKKFFEFRHSGNYFKTQVLKCLMDTHYACSSGFILVSYTAPLYNDVYPKPSGNCKKKKKKFSPLFTVFHLTFLQLWDDDIGHTHLNLTEMLSNLLCDFLLFYKGVHETQSHTDNI